MMIIIKTNMNILEYNQMCIDDELKLVAWYERRKAKYKTQTSKDRMDVEIEWGKREIERIENGYFEKLHAESERDMMKWEAEQ